MAEHGVHDCGDEVRRREATAALLQDLRALELVLTRRMIERGARRIGAEQEMFLVDNRPSRAMAPSPCSTAVLETLRDPRFTTELAKFNLEANLPPALLGAGALRDLERTLGELVRAADRAARQHDARVVLTGILPTLGITDLVLENLSPDPRYRALNDTLAAFRGEPFHLRIDGLDRFEVRHDNVMFEACNTSFQLHLQVEQDEFADLYNLAQAISAPMVAAAANSPVLVGHRLWRETRIALFEHATDARSDAARARRQPPRVRFGERWVNRSIVELFREDIARFPMVVAPPDAEESLEIVARGETPRLRALTAHNGTIWRWNRGCYGVMNGVPHLRIENRVLPSGPTVLDEVANAALFYGLMRALPAAYGPIARRLRFEDAKRNFFAAAREGLFAQLAWVDGAVRPARELLLAELIPHARRGLLESGVERAEVDRYLGVLEARVERGRTGADWTLDSFSEVEGCGTREARERAVVAGMLERQERGGPAHAWTLVDPSDVAPAGDTTLERVASEDVITLDAADPAALAIELMRWNGLTCVAVEDSRGTALGILSASRAAAADRTAPVGTLITDAPHAPFDMAASDALRWLRASGSEALLVVRDVQLIGVVTEEDLLLALADPPRRSRAA